MRILFITSKFHKTRIYREANALTTFGLKKELEKLGHKVDVLQTNKLFNKVKKKYDVIHSFSASPLRVLQNLLIRQNALRFHTLKSISSKYDKGYFLLKFVHKVVVPLHSMARGRNYSVININIDTKKFKPVNLKKYKRPTIIYYGALHPQRGVDNLIYAMAMLSSVDLIMIPRYNKLTELSKDARQLIKLCKNIKLLKSTEGNKLPYYINKCHLACFPYVELTDVALPPCVIPETWACKVPIITTNLPELKEVGAGCCIFAEPHELIKKIKYGLKYKHKKMVQKAYEKSKQFDNRKVALRYHNLYGTLLVKKAV